MANEKGAKENYDKGYGHGRNEAEYQKSHSVIDHEARNLGYSPQKSNNPAYRAGFNQGVKDGGGWTSSSGSGK